MFTAASLTFLACIIIGYLITGNKSNFQEVHSNIKVLQRIVLGAVFLAIVLLFLL